MAARIVTGLLSRPHYGLRMDVYGAMSELPGDIKQTHHLSKGDRLNIVDVARSDKTIPGLIGRASLSWDEMLQGYEATYEFDAPLRKWGRRGIMTGVMQTMLDDLSEYGSQPADVYFVIDPRNIRSIGLATKLGAKRYDHADEFYRLSVAPAVTEQRMAHV